MTPDTDALLQRNLMFLASDFPHLFQRQELLIPSETVQERDSTGRVVNIRLDADHLLYPEGETAIVRQVQSYLADPTRFIFQDAQHVNTLPERTRQWLGRLELPLSGVPSVDTGILFVVGLGMGLHLPALLTSLKPRIMVVMEPVADFFAHSLHVVDWEEIANTLRQRGGGLALIPGVDPRATLQDLREHFADDRWIGQVDGSYVYVHYQSDAIAAITEGLVPLLVQCGTSKGFVADERLMMRNTLTNLLTCPARTVSVSPQQELATPVFLVGAGPSLDEALPLIKAYRDRAIVVSCGTTLSLLLKNGITPHVQIELENTPLVYDLTAALAETYDLRPIHLIATSTVDPRVPALFDDVAFFVREGGCASLVAQTLQPLPAGEPNVVNAAFSALCLLGFREFYLFGIDLGRSANGAHHAQGAVYYNVLADLDERIEQEFILTAPGNFGGTVMTSLRLEAARTGLELLQAVVKTRLYNCSKGVAIDGARPLRPKNVKLAKAGEDPAAVLSDALATLPAHGPGDLVAGLDFRQASQRAHALADLFADAFHGSTTTGVNGLVDRGADVLAQVSNPEAALIKDSLWSVLRLVAFIAHRLENDEIRQAFLSDAEGEITATALEFAQSAAAILEELQSLIRTAPASPS